jgi:sulfonate transport system substrate-binding protein
MTLIYHSILLLFFCSVSLIQAQNLPTVRIGYQPSSSILWIGKAKGYYEKEFEKLGVKVEWDLFTAGPLAIEAAASDKVGLLAVGNMPPLVGKAGGIDLVIVAKAAFNPATNAVLVRPGSNIHFISDLKGKKVAAQIGSSVHYFLYQLLSSAGMSMDDIQLVNLNAPDQAAALESGAVDAVVSWMPYRAQLEKAGRARMLADSSKVPGSYSFYAARSDFAKENVQVMKAFIRATQKTNYYVKKHPAEAVKILAAASKFPASAWTETLKGFDYSMQVQPSEIAVMGDIKQFLLSNKVIRKDFPIESLFDDRYCRAVGAR